MQNANLVSLLEWEISEAERRFEDRKALVLGAAKGEASLARRRRYLRHVEGALAKMHETRRQVAEGLSLEPFAEA